MTYSKIDGEPTNVGCEGNSLLTVKTLPSC
nr:MAG TPA: hypothetical protein [Caudoviricetes sp.]